MASEHLPKPVLPPPPFSEPVPNPGEHGLRTSAIVFAYDEEAALRRCLPSLLESSVEEILVMYRGIGRLAALPRVAPGPTSPPRA